MSGREAASCIIFVLQRPSAIDEEGSHETVIRRRAKIEIARTRDQWTTSRAIPEHSLLSRIEKPTLFGLHCFTPRIILPRLWPVLELVDEECWEKRKMGPGLPLIASRRGLLRQAQITQPDRFLQTHSETGQERGQ
jgi:hypothetical protein